MAFEPLALGLLVAPSPAGAALAISMVSAFFARRPLKAAFADSAQPRPELRRVALLLIFFLGAGLTLSVILGGVAALWPLLLAAPLGGLFVYFDAQGDSRAAAAELAGSAAFAVLPAAFATLTGWPVPAALALAALALIRSVPTVLTVRTWLRRRKGRPVTPLAPLAAAGIGLGATIVMAVFRQTPWLTVGGAILLLLRTGWFATSNQPGWTARRVGQAETLLGVVYIALIATAYHLQ